MHFGRGPDGMEGKRLGHPAEGWGTGAHGRRGGMAMRRQPPEDGVDGGEY